MIKILQSHLLLSLMFISAQGWAQENTGTFQLLNVPVNAPLMAMGVINVSWNNTEPLQFLSNPALSSDSINNMAAFNYVAFSGAYKAVAAGYNFSLGSGNVNLAFRNLSFGELQGYDPSGNPTETFKVGQNAVTVGYQLSQGPFRYGVNLDFINSVIAGYRANAVSISVGGLFVHPKKDFSIGVTVKNLGFTIRDFTDESDSSLPWDVQVGASFKPQYMPFRFSLSAHHLFNNNILNDEIDASSTREILSHLVVGTELIITKNVSLMAGYNHLVRQELKLQQTAGGAGFSYGFIWRTKTIVLGYGRGAYHIAGASHVISLNADLNKIFRKI